MFQNIYPIGTSRYFQNIPMLLKYRLLCFNCVLLFSEIYHRGWQPYSPCDITNKLIFIRFKTISWKLLILYYWSEIILGSDECFSENKILIKTLLMRVQYCRCSILWHYWKRNIEFYFFRYRSGRCQPWLQFKFVSVSIIYKKINNFSNFMKKKS